MKRLLTVIVLSVLLLLSSQLFHQHHDSADNLPPMAVQSVAYDDNLPPMSVTIAYDNLSAISTNKALI